MEKENSDVEVGTIAKITEEIAKSDFSKLDIRIGKVLSAEHHPDADKLYIEQIDVGETTEDGDPKPRTIVSGIREHVPLDQFIGSKVLVLCNLKPQKLRGIKSHGMILCACNVDHTVVELLTPSGSCIVGSHVSAGFKSDIVPPSKLSSTVWGPCLSQLSSITLDSGDSYVRFSQTVESGMYEGLLTTPEGAHITCKSLNDFQVS